MFAQLFDICVTHRLAFADLICLKLEALRNEGAPSSLFLAQPVAWYHTDEILTVSHLLEDAFLPWQREAPESPDLRRENMMVDFVFLVKVHHYTIKVMLARFLSLPKDLRRVGGEA